MVIKITITATFHGGSLPVNPFIEGDKLATANYHLRRHLSIGTLPFSIINLRNDQDYGKLPSAPIVKTEQLKPHSISDNEGDNDDGDWQLEDEDNEELNPQEIRKSVKKKGKYAYRTKINGKIKCKFCSKCKQYLK